MMDTPIDSDSQRPLFASDELPDLTQSMNLVMRFKEGDQEALGALLERYQERIRRIVRIRLGSRLRSQVESLDIVQQVNVVAMRRLEKLELSDHASIMAWLSQIVLNQIRDTNKYFGADRRDMDRSVSIDEGSGDDGDEGQVAVTIVDDAVQPLDRAYESEVKEILDDAMQRLEPLDRDVILRRDYIGEDWYTIAHQLGYVDKQKEKGVTDLKLALDRAVHNVQEFHVRARLRLRRIAGPRLKGLL